MSRRIASKEIAELRSIDSTADRFELAWRDGARPQIEDFLRDVSSEMRARLLSELLSIELEWRDRHKLPTCLDEYRERFPDEAAIVSSAFAEWEQTCSGSPDQKLSVPETMLTDNAASTTIDVDHARESFPTKISVAEVTIPDQVGRYRILRLLGHGAMGAVYLALDERLNRQVALKVSKLDGDTDKAMRIERFQQEARAAAALHQPNICPVYDFGEIDGLHFITMAYVEGKTLQELIKSRGSFSEQEAAGIVEKLARALNEAHQVGVVHRDLKPANILIDTRDEPIILDFGLAMLMDRERDARITKSGMLIGSPAYMSPEQVSGDPNAVGPISDVYSLGVILYELLAGRLPFEGSAMAVISQIQSSDPPALGSLRSDLDSDLAAIVARMMARSSEDRYQSMQTVAEDLDHWNRLPPAARELAAHKSLLGSKLASRLRLGLPIGGALVAILIAVLIVFRTRHGDLQIEISDPRIRVELDGEYLQLTDLKWAGQKTAGKHMLRVAVNGTLIPIGKSLDVEIDGQAHRLIARLGDVELASREFELQRGQKTALKIQLDRVLPFGHLLENQPAIDEQFDDKKVLFEDADWLHRLHDGQLVILRKTEGPGLWRGIAMRSPMEPGLIEADVRSVGPKGSWLIEFVNPQLHSAVCFFIEAGILKAAIHTPENLQKQGRYRTLSTDLPAQSDDGYDRVQLFVRGRHVSVVLNGKRMPSGIDVPFDLTPGEVRLGATGTYHHTLSVEYDRFAFYPIANGNPVDPSRFSIDFDRGSARDSAIVRAPEYEKPPHLQLPASRGDAVSAQDKWAKSLAIDKHITTHTGHRMTLIPPGTFEMGENYRVTISKPYYMGVWEVRKRDFAAFVKETNYVTDVERGVGGSVFIDGVGGKPDPDLNWRNAGVDQTDEHPVCQVSCRDAEAFCRWLSKREGQTYRLPTEAEWEYACRAGTETVYHFGDDPAKLPEYAWFRENTDSQETHPVGQLKPNPWGLFDMHGNVLEWTAEINRLYPEGHYIDPRSGPGSDSNSRLSRGGSMIHPADKCTTRGGRPFYREHGSDDWGTHMIGFRIVREIPQPANRPFLFESPSAETLPQFVEARPTHEDDFDPSQVFEDNEDHYLARGNGRLVQIRKTPRPGGGWWAWHRMNCEAGLIDVDVRLVGERGGWIVNLHNLENDHGARVWLRDRVLYVGPSLFNPKQIPERVLRDRVLSSNAPCRTDGKCDNLKLLVEKRRICVYLNDEPMGPPIEVTYDLTPASIRLGLLGSPEGSTRVEYERLEFRRLQSHD